MKVYPIYTQNNYQKSFFKRNPLNPNISFGAIILQSINPQYEVRKGVIKDEIDTFSHSGKNATLLGKGISAEAFSFKKFPDIVIKQAFNKSETFADEESNLKKISSDITNTQRFVARAYDDEERCYYLLSTKVEGKSPDPGTTPWTQKHLKSLFDTMYKMDRDGLYHGDLNGGNMKLMNDGTVNFLDFQWTSQVSKTNFFEEKKISTLPRFIHSENSQMFEMAELPYYLKKISEKGKAKEFLKFYLTQKADYHEKRYDFIVRETQNWSYPSELPDIEAGKAFEKAQAVLFKNPSDDILKLETKKVQFLNAFREAYKHIDKNVPNKNIIPAPAAFLAAMSEAQDFRREVARQMKKPAISADLKAYLNAQEKYGEFWFNKLKTWTPDAFGFPFRHVANNLQNWETLHNFNNSNVDVRDFGAMTNILGNVDEKYEPVYTRNFSIKNTQNDTKIGVINSNIGNIAIKLNIRNTSTRLNARSNSMGLFNSQNSGTNTNVAAQELQDLKIRLDKAYQSGWGLDVLNLALLGMLRTRELSKSSSMYYSTAQDLQTAFSALAKNCYEQIFSEISNNGPSSDVLIGYKNMGNFG